MKYSLYDYLLNPKNPLSHVFLECMTREELRLISAKGKAMSEEEAKNRKLEVKLTIDGISVNPEKFFNLLTDQWERAINDKAQELVNEKLREPFLNIANKLHDMEQVVSSWAEEINWQAPNPNNQTT